MSGGWPYNTARWRKLRASKLRANPMCEYCPPHAQAVATEVDHKQAINNGGDPWDMGNLASSCGACHKSKTVADKQGRAWVRKGCGPDGMPLDDSHLCYRVMGGRKSGVVVSETDVAHSRTVSS
jgi:5-methylcytosine-specific restriction protein A